MWDIYSPRYLFNAASYLSAMRGIFKASLLMKYVNSMKLNFNINYLRRYYYAIGYNQGNVQESL